jgi:signal transduction histidine kinase
LAAFLMRTRRAWPLLAVYGAAAAIASLFVHEPPQLREWLLLALVSLSFVGCGAIAWYREPLNPVGPLMIVFGTLRATALLVIPALTPLTMTIGIIAQDFAIAVFVLLMLYFPTGRMGSPRDRWIAAVVLVALGPLELLWMSFLPPEGPGLPANLLAFWPSIETADAIDSVQRVLLAASQLALAVLIAWRWRRSSAARRRVLMPALVGSFTLFFFTAIFIVDKIAEQVPADVIWLYFVVFTAVPIAMLVQMVRARFAHTAIGDLLVSLSGEVAPEQLRGALARALHDPTLTIAYWLPEYGVYADTGGQPVQVEPRPGRAVTPIDREGQRIAVLEHDDALLTDPGLLDAITAAAGFALENARLQAELRAQLEELRGSRSRIIEATQDERRRLERNLHDGAQQRLVALSLELGMLEARYGADPEARAQIAALRGELSDSLAELRELARGLHPAVLTDHGLNVALEGLVARAPLPVHLQLRVHDRLPAAHEVAAYYLVSESLTNVAKYAHASSVTVEVARTNGELVVEVVDDGCGGATDTKGSGLRGLADRVEALDGRLRVWSPQGGGTRVRAEIPCG